MASLPIRTTLLVLCLVALAAPCWAAAPIGGSTGTFVVHAPVDGAQVWFDNDHKGAIAGGTLSVPVYTTATPYQVYRVEANGYEPFLGMITQYPASGGTVDLQAALVKEPIGGSMGAYRFEAAVEGAYVYLDGEFQGAIENGSLEVPVFTTGTPFRNYAVQARGFVTATGPVPGVPSAGETVAIPVALIPRAAPAAIGGDRGAYLVLCPVEGAMVAFDGDSKGTIQNGELLVPVYVTGTPYRTLRITAGGFQPYSAPISKYPAKGEVVNLYAVLEPTAPATTAAPIGGDIGYYLVHSNAEGGTVAFDDEVKGTITNGVLNVSVFVTGTPYRTWSVAKEGYAPFNGTISVYPAKGETIDLQAVLTVLPTTVATTNATTAAPATTATPLSGLCIAGALLSLAALGLAGRRR